MDHVERLEDIVLCFMIEKKEAVDQIEEICSIPGVDMIQFGPNDYCMSRGWNRADHTKEIREAEEKCIRIALEHGVRPRCRIISPKDAAILYQIGSERFCPR